MKKKSRESINLNKTLNSQHTDLKVLLESDWWKLLTRELHSIAGNLKDKLWTPRTDQTLKYNFDHLLKESLSTIYILMNLPEIMMSDLAAILSSQTEQEKPMMQRLEEHDKKMANDLKKYIKE